MSKYNEKTEGTRTENRAGGPAYKENDKLHFASLLLTSFVKSQFYRTEDETVRETVDLMNSIDDKEFLAKAAIFARNEYGMRSISHVVAGEMAERLKGANWSKRFFEKVIRRPDDMSEIMAYYLRHGKKPVPNSLKKGFAKAFDKFDEYQLAKYRSEGKDVSLIDIVNLVHPRPIERNANALKQLVEGTLRSRDTWESKLTEAGKKAETEEEKKELKAESWKDLIESKRIGYFALLRNLRNILNDAPELIEQACELLTDEKLIENSLVLPFRYRTALGEIEQLGGRGSRRVIQALSDAIDISCKNVPQFDGDTLVVLDVSGSMYGRVSEIASLFAAILIKANDADLMTFAERARYRSVNPSDSTLSIAKSLEFSGGGTNFFSIFETIDRKYDRIIILSDMQGWMGGQGVPKNYKQYCQKYGVNSHLYSFDLQGYGTLMFPESNVYCLAGFSDKVFDIMSMLESDRQALVNRIESIEL